MTADWKPLYPFTSHFHEVPGGRLHYVDEGPTGEPPGAPSGRGPVLCVHGNPTWSFYWRNVVKELSGAHRVVAVDHLGCGLSDKPEAGPYRLADHIARLESLVLALDLRDITLLMHDWGGAIGMGVAARHPERIARIGVFNTAAFPSARMPARIAACRIPGLGALGVRGLNGFAGAATFMATEKGLDPAVKAGLLAPYDSWKNRVAVLRFVEDIPMDPSHPSWGTLLEVEAGLAKFAEKPVLIGWGEKDWCFTPAFRQDWERRFPGAEVHKLADAGHYVIEDAWDALAPLLRAFAAGEKDESARRLPPPKKQRRQAVAPDPT